MKVSIITVTLNSGKTLQKAIDSVVNQDYKDIEYILIDGNSTDNTLEIIKKNKSISNFISEPDNGIYEAINKGIRLATGDIIGILNSDDIFASNTIISSIVDCFKMENADMVFGDLIYCSANNNKRSVRHWKSNNYHFSQLKYGWMPPHPTLYCRKSVYDNFGLYNENLQISSDYDFILRVFKQEELKKIYLPVTMIKMSLGGISNNSFSNILKKSKEDLKIIKRNEIGGFGTLLLKNIRKIKQFF